MTPGEFADSIPGFGTLRTVEQIKYFCWYLTEKGSSDFTTADLTRCFDAAHCQRPSSVSPFLKSLCERNPPFLLRKGGKHLLSRQAREEFGASVGRKESTIAVDRLLSDLPAKLQTDIERMYLEEALICFRHQAFRAAIVMVWNLAFDHLCSMILSKKLAEFNTTLPIRFPKAKTKAIANRDDFDDFKESEVLEIAKSARVITGNEFKVLSEKLNRRNIAAHPSGHVIKQPTAEDFIFDLVTNVVLKL